jgi:PKD repeat protein
MKSMLPFITFFCVLCLWTATASASTTSHVIYVAGDGTGNYNCNGTNDQVEINQALEYAANNPGTTVYLKGPFIYDIESSCLIGSNTELTGDSTAKLRLHGNIGWTKQGTGTPIVGQIGGYGTAVHDISIHGFEIDGNEMGESSGGLSNNGGGHDLYRIISFQGSSSNTVKNISCYNMNLHDSKGDGFRVKYGTNITAYGNTLANLQHCCIFLYDVNTGSIHDNTNIELCMSGVGLDDCQNIIVDSNVITPYTGPTSYPKDSLGNGYDDNGIQISNAESTNTSNIIIKNCAIKGGVNGIFLADLNDNCIVNIYKNTIHDSGYENEAVTRNGGIGITKCGNGITIQYNSITGSYNAGINVDSAASGNSKVTVSNNDIINGKTGYAVKNSVASNVSLILTHNYIYGNPADFYPSSLCDTNPATSLNTEVHPVLPTANFTRNVTSGYVPLDVQFTDLCENTTNLQWNFGDGSSNVSDANPEHVFMNSGLFNVVLTAYNDNGSASTTQTITVTAPPIPVKPTAIIGANTTSGYAPLAVQFSDLSTNETLGRTWTFGDGTTSNAQSPMHTYSKAGTYTVILTANNGAGSNTATKLNYITVTAPPVPPKPVAGFSATQTSGTAPLAVTFTDQSTGSPTKWKWSFGDGSTSAIQNPTHTYNKAGKYTVILTVTNAAGSNTVQKSNYITITSPPKPVAGFSATPTSGKATLAVQFTDMSTNSPTSWAWVFGDGSTSTTQNLVHKYTKKGTYTVSLTVNNAGGSSSVTKSKYITVK